MSIFEIRGACRVPIIVAAQNRRESCSHTSCLYMTVTLVGLIGTEILDCLVTMQYKSVNTQPAKSTPYLLQLEALLPTMATCIARLHIT